MLIPFLALGGKLLLRQIHLVTPFLDFLANDVGSFSFSCRFNDSRSNGFLPAELS